MRLVNSYFRILSGTSGVEREENLILRWFMRNFTFIHQRQWLERRCEIEERDAAERVSSKVYNFWRFEFFDLIFDYYRWMQKVHSIKNQ
jgi:hypothetical protein